MGEIDLDPCADPRRRVPATTHYTPEENGLEQSWTGKVFLNPPFSDSSSWIKHLSVYVSAETVTEAIVLVPVMTLSNKSAQFLMRSIAEGFVLLDRKLSFLDSNYEDIGEMSAFPFALVYVGDNFHSFINVFDSIGIVCAIKKSPSSHKPVACKYCGKIFNAKRSTAKYCSTTCRVEAYRNKTKQ